MPRPLSSRLLVAQFLFGFQPILLVVTVLAASLDKPLVCPLCDLGRVRLAGLPRA